MSWFQDLAGKAENILTKIDQNAATVLQQQTRPSAENSDVEAMDPLIEVTSGEFSGSKAPVVNAKPLTKILSLSVKSPPSRGLIRSSSTASHEHPLWNDVVDLENVSAKSDILASSRRSSVSSKREGTVIDFSGYLLEKNTIQDCSFSVEKELAATKIILAEVKAERDELKLELDSVQSLLSNSDADTRLKDMENVYQILLDEKNDLSAKLLLTEESNAKYVKSISDLESVVSKHIQMHQELEQQLEMARIETSNVTAELQQYRVRAHATLQLKEKMIEQLKQNVSSDGFGQPDELTLMELEQMKSEKLSMLEEIATLNKKYEDGKTFWRTMEHTLKATILDLEIKLEELQQKLSLETTKAMQLDDDLNMQQKELTAARDELVKQRFVLSTHIHEKETEIIKLRNQLQNRPSSPPNDLEQRLTSLTQSLVQKQTSLEAVTAERNALRIQLEKLDVQYRSTVSQIRQERVAYTCSNETDDAKSQVPNFMVENPFDNRVARRVKRAYSSLDSVGIRLGVFLRRYPLIRIMVIVYVAVLHLWVMFVLLSTTPA
ncbi:golgin-84 [Topomyia yanbarensis]|uniref:golgin-84 n=1 Tax=Topomyia yanbarensis TaxID=2498891 RepID=UPI00273C97BF|nr:golgin-84 [Topomyia yanbarensis]